MNNFLRKTLNTFSHIQRNYPEKLRDFRLPYLSETGSAPIANIKYEIQLETKRSLLQELFCDYVRHDNYEFFSSPKEFEYRFKMDYVCSFNPKFEPFSRFGQRKFKNFSWVIDMHDDILIPSEYFKKIRSIYDFLQNRGIENYDLKMSSGNLRYITIKAQDEQMVTITSFNRLPPLIINEIENKFGNLFNSIVFLQNNTKQDTSDGELYHTIHRDFIFVSLQDKTFKVKYDTFFQNNIYVFESLLEYVGKYLEAIKDVDRMIDLFCGIGTFGIIFNKFFKNIIGIDNNESNIQVCNDNLKLNKIKNYIPLKNNLYVDSSDFEILPSDLVIVDPPRSGLGNKLIKKFLEKKPSHIIYISCNPDSQLNDLKQLDTTYCITTAVGFDMFPNTYHIENLVFLERK